MARRRGLTDSVMIAEGTQKAHPDEVLGSSAIKHSASGSNAGSPGGDLPKRRLSWQEDFDAIPGGGGSTSSKSPGSDRSSPNSRSSRGMGLAMLGGMVGGGMGKARSEPSPTTKQKIDDRRSIPSLVDHTKIVNSFTQGLASVEKVIVYDVNADEWEDHEGDRGRKGSGTSCWTWLGAACLALCGCHSLSDAEANVYHQSLSPKQ